jgi:hypothetical protein
MHFSQDMFPVESEWTFECRNYVKREDTLNQSVHFHEARSIICGLVGRATTFVGVDVGSIPTCGALEVWQWTFGS